MEASVSSKSNEDDAVINRVQACESRVLKEMIKTGEKIDEMKSQFADEFQSLENEIRFLKMKNERLEEKLKSSQPGNDRTTTTEKNVVVTSPCTPDVVNISSNYLGNCTTIGFVGHDTPLLTALAPRALVSQGQRCWFEVTMIQGTNFQVGWTTPDYKSTFSYHPSEAKRQHNTKTARVATTCTGFGVLGVGADMAKGRLLFSWNGDWSSPGVIFEGADVSSCQQLLPHFAGRLAKIEVNFGGRKFSYGPPDSRFVTLLDAAKIVKDAAKK